MRITSKLALVAAIIATPIPAKANTPTSEPMPIGLIGKDCINARHMLQGISLPGDCIASTGDLGLDPSKRFLQVAGTCEGISLKPTKTPNIFMLTLPVGCNVIQ